MADVHQLFPGEKPAPDLDAVPPLPVEGHIVAAALTAESLRTMASQVLLVLQHSPRDVASYNALSHEMLAAWRALDDHYRAYLAVLECQGQA